MAWKMKLFAAVFREQDLEKAIGRGDVGKKRGFPAEVWKRAAWARQANTVVERCGKVSVHKGKVRGEKKGVDHGTVLATAMLLPYEQ